MVRRMSEIGEVQRGELASMVRSGRVHSAYLLEGPDGSGAAETGIWLARRLLCTALPVDRAGPGDDPCEICHGCRLSRCDGATAAHPDLHVVRGDGSTLKVDAVRALQKALSLTANEQGRRIGLLFDAEQLNLAAANALLKTLEEPPAATTLILVARSAAGLPATIHSRSTRVRFAPLGESALREALEASGCAADEARLAAALGGSSLHAARQWLELQGAQAREMLDQLASLEPARSAALDVAEGFRGAGVREKALLFLDVYALLARDDLRAAVASRDAAATERALARIEAVQRARRELEKRNVNPQLTVESLLLAAR
jgi:DNA polymerase III subunit delta'